MQNFRHFSNEKLHGYIYVSECSVMLINLSRLTAICQSVAEKCHVHCNPLNQFNMNLFSYEVSQHFD